MNAQPALKSTYTVDAYLQLDAEAEDVRYEYLDGRIYALAGASPEHNLIKENISGELHRVLRPAGCRSYSSDQRVQLTETRYVYPDVVALCGDPEYTDDRPASLLNPEWVVEVLSETTARRDWLHKFDAYLQLESLREYWLVDSAAPYAAQCIRHGDEWVVRPYRGLDHTVSCEAFDLEVSLNDMYALVEFPDEADNGEAESEAASESSSTDDAES